MNKTLACVLVFLQLSSAPALPQKLGTPSLREVRAEGWSELSPRCVGAAGIPSLREVRAEGWSELSPRCVGAAARRAGLSPLFCDAPISRRPVCFLMHTLPPFGPAELGGFFLEFLRTDSEFGASRPLRERIRGHRGSISLRSFFSRH